MEKALVPSFLSYLITAARPFLRFLRQASVMTDMLKGLI